MSIAHRETEISVVIGHEPPEASAMAVIAWYPDIKVVTMRSYCNRDGVVLLLVTTNAVKTAQVLKASRVSMSGQPRHLDWSHQSLGLGLSHRGRTHQCGN